MDGKITVPLASMLKSQSELRVTDTVSPSAGLTGNLTTPTQLLFHALKLTLLPTSWPLVTLPGSAVVAPTILGLR